MKRIIFFFCAPFPSVNPSVIIFFYYQRTKNYRWKIHRRRILVGDFVGKLIANRIIVQISIKNSVGKFKDCDSVSCALPHAIFNTNLSLYTTSTPRFVLYYVTVSILLILVISPFNSLTFFFILVCFVWFCMDIWLLMLIDAFFLGWINTNTPRIIDQSDGNPSFGLKSPIYTFYFVSKYIWSMNYSIPLLPISNLIKWQN
jgi:hypothetical protein